MKKLFYLTAGIIMFNSCDFAGDSDYKNIAKDLCDCTNNSTSKISPETKKALSDASKNNKGLEDAMKKLTEENPEKAMNDGVAIMSLGTDLQNCMTKLESKYKDLKTMDEDKDIQDKMIKAFEQTSNCEVLTLIMKEGIKKGIK